MSAIINSIKRDLHVGTRASLTESTARIEESFDSTHNSFTWTMKTPTHWSGTFTIKGRKFTVDIKTNTKRGSQTIWSVTFSASTTVFDFVGLTMGYVSQVYGTVINAVFEFVKSVKPQTLIFISKQDKRQREFYRVVATKLRKKIKELGYKMSISTGNQFTFKRKSDKDEKGKVNEDFALVVEELQLDEDDEIVVFEVAEDGEDLPF